MPEKIRMAASGYRTRPGAFQEDLGGDVAVAFLSSEPVLPEGLGGLHPVLLVERLPALFLHQAVVGMALPGVERLLRLEPHHRDPLSVVCGVALVGDEAGHRRDDAPHPVRTPPPPPEDRLPPSA